MFTRKAAGRHLQVLSFLNRAVCTAAAAALIALGAAAPGRAAGETAEFSAPPKPATKRRKAPVPKLLRSSRPSHYICTPSGFGQTSRCYRRG